MDEIIAGIIVFCLIGAAVLLVMQAAGNLPY